MVYQPALIPYKFFIHAVKGRALMKRSCWIILNIARSGRSVVFRGAPLDLPGTNVPVAACLQRRRLTVARVRPTRPAIAFCRMPSWACASTACLIPIGVARGIIRIINNNCETICSCWFELATVQMQIWPNDHLSCGFEFRRSHFALKWKSGQCKVGFHWAAFTGTFFVNFRPLEAQKFDSYQFCSSNGSVAIFFQECISLLTT